MRNKKNSVNLCRSPLPSILFHPGCAVRPLPAGVGAQLWGLLAPRAYTSARPGPPRIPLQVPFCGLNTVAPPLRTAVQSKGIRLTATPCVTPSGAATLVGFLRAAARGLYTHTQGPRSGCHPQPHFSDGKADAETPSWWMQGLFLLSCTAVTTAVLPVGAAVCTQTFTHRLWVVDSPTKAQVEIWSHQYLNLDPGSTPLLAQELVQVT